MRPIEASDPDVIAGNGTIGLEILEDLPDMGGNIDPGKLAKILDGGMP